MNYSINLQIQKINDLILPDNLKLLFLFLVCQATPFSTIKAVKNTTVHLQEGELFISLRKIAQFFNIDKMKASRMLKILSETSALFNGETEIMGKMRQSVKLIELFSTNRVGYHIRVSSYKEFCSMIDEMFLEKNGIHVENSETEKGHSYNNNNIYIYARAREATLGQRKKAQLFVDRFNEVLRLPKNHPPYRLSDMVIALYVDYCGEDADASRHTELETAIARVGNHHYFGSSEYELTITRFFEKIEEFLHLPIENKEVGTEEMPAL